MENGPQRTSILYQQPRPPHTGGLAQGGSSRAGGKIQFGRKNKCFAEGFSVWNGGRGGIKDDSWVFVLSKWVEPSQGTPTTSKNFQGWQFTTPICGTFRRCQPFRLVLHPKLFIAIAQQAFGWVSPTHLTSLHKHFCLRCGLELFCFFSRNDLQAFDFFVFVCLSSLWQDIL